MKLLASILLFITLIPIAVSQTMQFAQFMMGAVQKNVRTLKTTFWKVVTLQLKQKATFIFIVTLKVNFLHFQ